MNILYLTTHLNIGGITTYLLSLSEALRQRGHKIYIASSAGELVPQFREKGVRHIFIPINTKSEASLKIWLSLAKLMPEIKKEGIDIIHAHTRVTQVLAGILSYFCRKPYISTCHGFFKKRLFRRICGCWGNMTIAISQPVKEHLISDFRVKEGNIRVVHNGIDLERFRADDIQDKIKIRIQMGLGNGPVIGIISRLSEVKGHVYLIEAMKAVLKKAPDAQLLIVGEGRMKKGLIVAAGDAGISSSVFFYPAVLDTNKALSAMDIFVLPSLKEGLGLSLMEAMAKGIAVIGSRVGGIQSLIRDGYNGILVEPADTYGISAAILRLLDNPAQAQALGEKARDFIARNFSLDEMAEETERVYRECLSVKY
ncbi:MAG: glycosyltransferase family 4 protein [Candidatus Omnitrophota bacterium]